MKYNRYSHRAEMQADKFSGDVMDARAVVINGHPTCFEASGIIGAATA